jgi:HK97 family phage prohead protease
MSALYGPPASRRPAPQHAGGTPAVHIIEGYAALFGVEDQMHDIVRAGAFAASIARRAVPLPMLVEHERRLLAGYWTELHEDSRGLFLRGEIRDDQPGAARAKRMIARGVDGLSIGFVPIVAHAYAKGRVLTEIELLEVSIVTHPMQHFARLTARSRQSAVGNRQPGPSTADWRLPTAA